MLKKLNLLRNSKYRVVWNQVIEKWTITKKIRWRTQVMMMKTIRKRQDVSTDDTDDDEDEDSEE